MQVLTKKVTVTEASHELRVRIRPDALITWRALKSKAVKSLKRPMSDSAFLHHLLADLAKELPPTFISVSDALSIPVAKPKSTNSEYGSPTIDNINNLTM